GDLISRLEGPIMVTGAGGFVGARLYRLLVDHRDDVVAVVRGRSNWRLDGVDPGDVEQCDLTDPGAVDALIERLRPRTVFHFVSYGAYPFEDDPERIYRTNVGALVHLVDRLAQQGCAAFVHAGSSSEYGTNCEGPTEDGICAPNSVYAASKVAASQFLQMMGELKAFPSANLRLSSVYGPLEDTSRFMPTLVRAAVGGGLPPLVEPSISRDFVFVDDVCRAFIQVASSLRPEHFGHSFNVGTGTCTTILDAVDVARHEYDVEEEPAFGTMPNRRWDLPRWYADPSLISREFGWKATVELDDGMRATAEWVETLTDEEFHRCSKSGARNPSGVDVDVNRAGSGISAVVACFRDEQAIPEMHRRLTEVLRILEVPYELIFVNDGSPDSSEEAIRSITAEDPRVLGITHSRNFGSQMAFRSGMELSTMGSVVLLDGDLQDPPELISRFHTLWVEGYEVVYGVRSRREMSRLRNFGHKAFYRLFRRFSYIDVPVDAGDFGLMDRRVVDWILASPERDLFMRGLRAFVGFRQIGVDYVRPERPFGESTNDFRKNIGWAKRGIFSFSDVPLTILSTVGALAFLGSALAGIVVAGLRLLVPDIAPRGATTLLLGILFFGSLNLLAIGLVGEYVAKIMTEVKGRPRLIRAALIRGGRRIDLHAP
ncbi:MAG: NAD-dependent epimerase/dehydratase family protein, partial [Acidimicrobiales bacterium]|nr:NAD-dependent epimerase/dehydratase family protein [Acidimicrobiales bacterium]